MRYEFISMMRDLIFQFGGLLFWPIARIIERDRSRRNEILRGIFTMHIVAFILVLAVTILTNIVDLGIFIPSATYFKRIGLLSIIAAVITLAASKRKDPDDY